MWSSLVRIPPYYHCISASLRLNKLQLTANDLVKCYSTNPDLQELADAVIEPCTERKQVTELKPAANENYFRSIAWNTDTNTKSIEDIDFSSQSNNEQRPEVKKFNSMFVSKANEFAREVIRFPSKPKFREFQTRTKKEDRVYAEKETDQVDNKKNEFSYQKSLRTSNHKRTNHNNNKNSKKTNFDDQLLDYLKTESANNREISAPGVSRNLQNEVAAFRTEQKIEQSERREFFKHQRKVEDKNELGGQPVQREYRLNRNKDRKNFVKEKRSDFKKAFLEFNKQPEKIEEIKLPSNSIVPTEPDSLSENDLIEEDIRNIRPVARQFVYNLSYFVKDSPVLQAFISMGVMIKKWDQDKQICDAVLKLDLERDVKPCLIFLHDIKIPSHKHAFVIEKNPRLFQEDLNDLETRVDYLRSKRFSEDNIAEIITRAPRWLRLSVEQVDTKLGWIQNEFNLTGNQLREVIISKPKLVTLPLKIIADARFCLKDFLGFDDTQIKYFMTKNPKLFTKHYQILEANYNYLTKVIKLSNQQIASYSPILHAPLNLVRTRYAFLKNVNRVQFDVTQPNFISIKSMVEHDEKKFLEKYAKCSEDDYNHFLKTI